MESVLNFKERIAALEGKLSKIKQDLSHDRKKRLIIRARNLELAECCANPRLYRNAGDVSCPCAELTAHSEGKEIGKELGVTLCIGTCCRHAKAM